MEEHTITKMNLQTEISPRHLPNEMDDSQRRDMFFLEGRHFPLNRSKPKLGNSMDRREPASFTLLNPLKPHTLVQSPRTAHCEELIGNGLHPILNHYER